MFRYSSQVKKAGSVHGKDHSVTKEVSSYNIYYKKNDEIRSIKMNDYDLS